MDINRKTAYKVLLRMEQTDAYSNIELNAQLKQEQPDSPGFVRELVYGVTERRLYLDFFLSQLVSRGLKNMKAQPLTVLRMGLYQLMFMDSVPDYAAVDESVQLARRYCFGQAGLVNGVLRNYQRNKDKLKKPKSVKNTVKRLSYEYSFAPCITKMWLDQYGLDRTREIMEASNETPPVMIRVNPMKTDADTLIARLEENEIQAVRSEDTDRILICKGKNILDTMEYHQGWFSVQDEASVLAVEAFKPQPNDLIIDVCAAPGGKAMACAEIMNNTGKIMAFDLYEKKINHMKEEADRLGVTNIEASVHDATKLDNELVGKADRVICDVPCSGLGVVRRKPEIKYKKLINDGKDLAKLQLSILETAAKYVKEGGQLMYSTCTINANENTGVISAFLGKHSNFNLGRNRQLLPNSDGTDGFYYCKMKKRY